MTQLTNAQSVSKFVKKYELTDETIEHEGRILHRIRALRDIPLHGVNAGDLGGFIEIERNLSHRNDAWISDNARAFGDAWIYGNAWMSGNAWAFGSVWLFGNAKVFGDARLSSGKIGS